MPKTTAFIAEGNLQCPSLDGPFKMQQTVHKPNTKCIQDTDRTIYNT